MKTLACRPSMVLSCLAIVFSILACEVPPGWISSLAPGGTWYVTTTGHDSNDCLSAATACLTVGAAVTKARTGGIVQIGPGPFGEIAADLPETGVHIHGKVITLQGTLTGGVPATMLDGAAVRTPLVVDGTDVVILQDLIIQAGGSTAAGSVGAGLKISGAAGAPAGVSLRNVIIRNNILHGIVVSGPASVTLDGVQVTGNRSDGIVVSGAQVDVRNSLISANGVGLVNMPTGNVAISDTTIAGNSGHPGGGVINQAEMRIERSTISGNSDTSPCGLCGFGIQNDGTLTLLNSTIAGNAGAGIRSDGELKMAYSTSAGNGGSGFQFGGGSLAMGMNIVENNAAQDCSTVPGSSLGGASATWYTGIISDGSCGPSITGLPSRPGPDPYLGPLAANGGPTQTMALTFGSLAINTRSGSGLLPPFSDHDFDVPPTDQRGMPRPDLGGGHADAGAYEYQFPAPLVYATAVTETAKATPTLLLIIPEPSQTATPGAQLLLLKSNANCRKGPGTGYNIVTAFEQGTSLQALARNQDNTWLQVAIPTGGSCWLAESALPQPAAPDDLPVLPAPPLPETPQAFTDKASCVIKLKKLSVKLSWSDVSSETGYHVYRNGALLETLSANVTTYLDGSAPLGKDLTYELEAFNANGSSERAQTVVSACK